MKEVKSVVCAVNHIAPSGPGVISFAPVMFGSKVYRFMKFLDGHCGGEITRHTMPTAPASPPVPSIASPNHIFPSGPAVIPQGVSLTGSRYEAVRAPLTSIVLIEGRP